MLNFLRYRSISKALIKEHNRNRPKEKHHYICHAPFESLRFNQSGIATVCCFNREHSLGIYPKDALRSIWFGEKAKNLREHIKHRDLGLGCFYCKHQIENREFSSVKTAMYDHLPLKEHLYPQQMEFELHNICNLECIMCSGQNSSSIRKNRDKLPNWESPYNEAFVEQLEEFLPYLRQASFIGGEPFLIDIYYTIWDRIAAVSPKMDINVTTNGTILNNRVKEVLKRGDFSFSISLESIRNDTYAKIRVNGKCDELLKNIEYFIQYCKERGTGLCIWVCPVRQNWQEIPEIIEYFNVREIPVYLHTVWFPPYLALWNLSSKELQEIDSVYGITELEADTEVRIQNRDQFNELRDQVKSWSAQAKIRESGPVESKAVSELENRFTESLKEHLMAQTALKRSVREAKWDLYRDKAAYWLGKMRDTEKSEILQLMAKYPIERIAGEFELWDRDELCNRLSGIGYSGT